MTRRRQMSAEEEALWRKATRDVARYEPQHATTKTIVSEANSNGRDTKQTTPKRKSVSRPGTVRPTKTIDRVASGDPRLDRLAGRGRLEIDAVLDLHGHRQATARAALHRFIEIGHARGAKCLLVITGKGAGGSEPASGRGVLRARFADWINEDAVRGLVSRAASAHQRHGGAGAFYVFLKR
ncbi:Smr/MutS family protein [Hyphococcus sp.]|uniref:Smr/MutS family protein n=1 Tax=Hyphococcus sp. TaxID=2038636 RepID=UPI003CCBDF76